MDRILRILIFVFLTSILNLQNAFSAAVALPSQTWLDQIQELPDLQLVITPEQDYSEIFKAFKSAEKNIKVGIFGISSKDITSSLIEQSKRGIQVTVICDKYCTSNPKRLALFEELKAAGVNMVVASPGFSITHWKMFVIDDRKAFISTMNYISRFYQMRDFGVFTEDPAIVQEILTVYQQDLINAQNSTQVTPLLTSPYLIWSPVNSEGKLVDLINQAEKSIEIWIENLGNAQVHSALKKAVERKVNVRILTSVCGMGADHTFAYTNYKDLIPAGVTIRGMPFPATQDLPYIHAKSIHVDKQLYFLGSENFSYNSLVKARELGIVFKNNAIQAQLDEYFEKDWAKSVAIPETPPESCEALTAGTSQDDLSQLGMIL